VTASRPQVLRFDDGGWLELIGGHRALDLVNTVSWRGDAERRTDHLGSGAALVRWAGFAGVAPTRLTADDDADRAATEVRGLREDLYAVLRPVLDGGDAVPSTAVENLRDRYAGAVRLARAGSALPLRWAIEVRSAADLSPALTLVVVDLLEHADLGRLRECRDEGCGWVFLDRTRNRSRVWCSSADCGNRTRARRHYARTRPGPGSPPPKVTEE
jgi:predicted RNA-binding Zn ribbon-like protein